MPIEEYQGVNVRERAPEHLAQQLSEHTVYCVLGIPTCPQQLVINVMDKFESNLPSESDLPSVVEGAVREQSWFKELAECAQLWILVCS